MISQIKQKGFTIVELLIVIVVIAILAALSYVGYTSITARANNSTAAASAKAVKDAAQVYASANGAWPTTKTHLTTGGSEAVAKLPSDVLFPATATGNTYGSAATAVQGSAVTSKTVFAYPCGTTGLRIYYKDFTSGAANGKYMDAGDCSTAPAAATAVILNAS